MLSKGQKRAIRQTRVSLAEAQHEQHLSNAEIIPWFPPRLTVKSVPPLSLTATSFLQMAKGKKKTRGKGQFDRVLPPTPIQTAPSYCAGSTSCSGDTMPLLSLASTFRLLP